MLSRRSLDPEQRVLYGASLQPPPGYVFDAAVATTFSLDFETALAAPVSLALFAAENREDIISNPLALLEGAERIAGRLLIFTDAGHIQADSRSLEVVAHILADNPASDTLEAAVRIPADSLAVDTLGGNPAAAVARQKEVGEAGFRLVEEYRS